MNFFFHFEFWLYNRREKFLYEKIYITWQLFFYFIFVHQVCLKLTRKIIRTWCTTRRKLTRFLMWNKTGWELEVWKQFLLQRFFNFLCGSLFQCGGSRWIFRTLPYFQCERIYVCWGRNNENIQPWEINFPMKKLSFPIIHVCTCWLFMCEWKGDICWIKFPLWARWKNI